MLRAVLAEARGTLVSVVTSSKFKVHWGVFVGSLVVSFCFLSWDVAISFARSLGCGRGRLSGWDVGCIGVGCIAGSWVCRAPHLEECLQHHGQKGDPGVMPETCGAIGERAQGILVWMRAPGRWERLPPTETKSHEG